jgi:membrane protein required for colicin V production
MNFIDIVLSIPICWFTYQGFRKGFVLELASLLGLILGIYASFHFAGYFSGYLTDYLNIPEKYAIVASFIGIFLVVVLILYLIAKIIGSLIDLIALGFLNKLAGCIFGFLKGIVLISLVILILDHFDRELISEEKKEESILYKPIASVATILWNGFENFTRDKLPDISEPPKNNTVYL